MTRKTLNTKKQNVKAQPLQSGGQAIVYNDFDGTPLKVTFLGNRWWVTTPGERLQPLEDYFDDEDINFNFLCGTGDKVGALALAKMLGKALENPEYKVDEVMRQRVEELKRMGVTLNVKDEPLEVELELLSNEGASCRQGKFSVWCHLTDDFCERFFDIDAFETKKDAEEWVGYYFDFLESLGIDFKIIYDYEHRQHYLRHPAEREAGRDNEGKNERMVERLQGVCSSGSETK